MQPGINDGCTRPISLLRCLLVPVTISERRTSPSYRITKFESGSRTSLTKSTTSVVCIIDKQNITEKKHHHTTTHKTITTKHNSCNSCEKKVSMIKTQQQIHHHNIKLYKPKHKKVIPNQKKNSHFTAVVLSSIEGISPM